MHWRRHSSMAKAQTTQQSPALSLYSGTVMHARLKPVCHRFSYGMTSILIDLDRLQEANRASPVFSVNGRNLLAFHEADHGPRDGTPLRKHVDRLLGEAGLAPAARIQLLCYPSVAGYTFNPVSVYFCKDEAGAMTALIYQVHNTFGESHSYVEPVRAGQASEAGIRQTRRKALYVSPFLDMDMTYRFRIRPPEHDVAFRILENDRDGPILSASFYGIREEATTTAFMRAILKTAGIAWKVTAGIHFEALRLWLKGLKLTDRPVSPIDKKPGASAQPDADFVAGKR